MGRHKMSLAERKLAMRTRETARFIVEKERIKNQTKISLLAEKELLEIEQKRIRARQYQIDLALNAIYEKDSQIQIKLQEKLKKNLAVCPACGVGHEKSPPDECWLAVHKEGYESILAKTFDAYLRKNKWGSLDL